MLEDDLLARIDAQLAAGDQSGTFHGERYDKCPHCNENWHALAITDIMQRLRQGMYGVDEFMRGIIPPDYRYDTDISDYVCPGSEWRGPPVDDREWKWAKRRWGRSEPVSSFIHQTYGGSPSPLNPDTGSHCFRFVGPWDDWTISMNDDRVIERDSLSGEARVVREDLRCSLEYEQEMKFSSYPQILEFVAANNLNISDTEIIADSEGYRIQIPSFSFPYLRINVHADSPLTMYPDWVEVETDYDLLNRHPWLASVGWSVSSRGHEADFVIIDEAYDHSDEELTQYVREVQEYTRRLAGEAAIPAQIIGFSTAQEASDFQNWRQAILQRGEEAATGHNRQVADGALPEEVQASGESAGSPGDETSEETRTAGPSPR